MAISHFISCTCYILTSTLQNQPLGRYWYQRDLWDTVTMSHNNRNIKKKTHQISSPHFSRIEWAVFICCVIVTEHSHLPGCIQVSTSGMWCSPCAPRRAAPPGVVYLGTLCSPLLPVCLLRATTSAVQWFQRARLVRTLQAFWMKAGLFSLVFRWRYSPAIIRRGRRLFFSPTFGPLFSTLFQQNAGRAFRARRPRSALVARGRLTEGGSRLPFHPILP